jgi:hypothetical protein
MRIFGHHKMMITFLVLHVQRSRRNIGGRVLPSFFFQLYTPVGLYTKFIEVILLLLPANLETKNRMDDSAIVQ